MTTCSAPALSFEISVSRVSPKCHPMVGEDNGPDNPPKRKRTATARDAGLMMIADVVGLGILTLGSAMALMGWALGLSFLVLMCLANLYTGLLLSRVQQLYPMAAATYPALGSAVLGNTFGKIVAVSNYVTLFSILGDYLLTIGDLLNMLLSTVVYICPWVWTAVAVALLVPFHQQRTLTETKALLGANALSITVAVFLALGFLWHTGSAPLAPEYWEETKVTPGPSYVVPPNLTASDVLNGLSLFCFAFSGQFLYVEMMGEMAEPKDFPKAFAYSMPYQLIMYALVGITAYAYLGENSSGLIIGVLPHSVANSSGAYLAATALLLFHMIVAYLTKGIIFVRALQRLVAPEQLDNPSCKSRLHWLGLTLLVLAGAFLIANLVPDFSDLSSLIGALFLPLSTLLYPALMFWKAMQLQGKPLGWGHTVGCLLCVVASIVFCSYGTYSAVSTISSKMDVVSGPFSCGIITA